MTSAWTIRTKTSTTRTLARAWTTPAIRTAPSNEHPNTHAFEQLERAGRSAADH